MVIDRIAVHSTDGGRCYQRAINARGAVVTAIAAEPAVSVSRRLMIITNARSGPVEIKPISTADIVPEKAVAVAAVGGSRRA